MLKQKGRNLQVVSVLLFKFRVFASSFSVFLNHLTTCTLPPFAIRFLISESAGDNLI